mgnify:CR=1 FL=1
MTQFVDLDSVVDESPLQLKLNGKIHLLKVADVETFLINLKEIEELPLDASPRQEIELYMRLIKRAFPTIEDTELRKLTMAQLKKVNEVAQGVSGQKVEQTGGDEGNATPES